MDEADLRIALLCLLSSSLLASCASYHDIHSKTKLLTESDLSGKRAYHKVTTKQAWWQRFKNPQLNQLIEAALSNSPNMQTAAARILKAEKMAEAANTTRWPTLDFSGYMQRQRFSERGLIPPPFNGNTYNIMAAGLNFNYEFDFWGKNQQIFKASLSEYQASKAELAEAELILSAAVANTYFQLIGLKVQAQLANINVKISKQQLSIATNRSHQGIASAIPIKTLENNLQSATQIQTEIQKETQLAEHQLAVLMGNNPFTSELLMKNTASLDYRLPLKSHLPANLLANRPDIQAAKWRVQAAAHRVNVAKARFFPDINLNALFSYQGVGTGFGHLFDPGNQTNGVAAAIDLPIFDAGLRRANLGARYADYDLAISLYNQTLLTALQQVADQLTTVHTVSKQLNDENLAVEAIKQRYKLIQSRYNHGIDDYSIVIESKQVLLQRLAARQTLQTRRLQAIVNLIRALGGSDSKDG